MLAKSKTNIMKNSVIIPQLCQNLLGPEVTTILNFEDGDTKNKGFQKGCQHSLLI